ncbi:hypothetical protein ACP4OV_024906 [Aristida adscensionis]
MVSQHGVLLAVGIISDHFGPLVSKVFGCLLRHGALSLQEIVRRLELSPGGAAGKTVTLYLAIFDNVLHRLRFPKFLAIVRADIPESEDLLEGLLLNGRLTFDQLVERTMSKVPEGSIPPSREEIRMNFNKLVYSHYVERCPKPEPFFDPLVDEQSTSTRKRAHKESVENVLSLEQKVVNTAALSNGERFSEIPYTMDGVLDAKDSIHDDVAGRKRKHEALEEDDELSTIAENEVLWRANFEKFVFCLKKKFCAERKKPTLKLGTHPIWEAFFEANAIEKDNKSVTSPINGIFERLGQKEGVTSMTLDQIKRILADLKCFPSGDNTEEFTFDLSEMVETCRTEEIQSLVKKKYGQEAFLIFRLLAKEGRLVETDTITDTTILDKQVVHEILYKLWKDEYIDAEKVVSATGSGNAQFFVWKVKNTYQEHFIDNLYHAALNLRQMVNCMAELILEVRPHHECRGVKDETVLRSRKNMLILALNRHDESLMLFHDY